MSEAAVSACISSIKAPDTAILASARHAMDFKTKPQGSLGRLEDAGIRMSCIQGSLTPRIDRSMLLVFAADHGIAREGVSAFPPEVTAQMVLNFLAGGAAINVLCRQKGIALRVVDMGVNADFPGATDLISAKVAKGTRSFLREPAMTRDQAWASLAGGMDAFNTHVLPGQPQIFAVGEMGIGNTSSASAVIAAFCGASPREVCGRGTGITDEGLERKIQAITTALDLHKPDPADPLGVLSAVGGFEIGGMAGAILAAAAAGIPTVLDGIIATSAGLLAARLAPAVKGYLFSGHRSVEQGQAIALASLGLEPLVDLGLRLGEGTGAALAIHFIDASCRIMSEMASFESAGVSNREG